MKKKLAALLCGVLCVFLLTVPVYAGSPDVTVTDGGVGGDDVIVADTEPVSVTAETVDGVPVITKVYELPQGRDAAAYTAAFEQDGYLFTSNDISVRTQEARAHSKTMSQTETLESESGKVADIIAQAAPVALYNEGGYTGQLALDAAAIIVEENGAAAYSYRVEDVREYTNLDRSDAAYVPKTVTKNGIALQLENIEWVVMGTTPADGRMVPNLFTAVAAYAGTATGSRAAGYTAILTYTGEVTQMIPGKSVYTVVFRGEPIAASETETVLPAEDAPKKTGGFFSVLAPVLIVLLSLAGIALAGIRIYQYIRDRRAGRGAVADVDSAHGEEDAGREDTVAGTGWQTPQGGPEKTCPQDEYSLDGLFSEEDFFNA